MRNVEYIVTYTNRVSFGTHNSHEVAWVKTELEILADGMEEAIAKSKEALRGLMRDNNGAIYPFIDKYELVSIAKKP